MTDAEIVKINVVPINTIQPVTHDAQPWQRSKSSAIRIRKCPAITIECEGVVKEALVDTGCTTTVVSEEMYEELKAKGKEIMCLPMNRAYVIGATQKKSSPITKQIMFRAMIGDQAYEIVALVVKKLLHPVILGTDFLVDHRAIIDLERQVVELGSQAIGFDLGMDEEHEACTGAVTEESLEDQLRQQTEKIEILNTRHKEQLLQLLMQNKEVFQKNRAPIKGFTFRIQLTDTTPFRQRNYPIPAALKQDVAELLASMVKDGIIRKAQTSYTNPIVIVKKKDGGIRLCLDARRLNAVTKPYRDAPLSVEEALQRFGGNIIFSSTDFSKAYWQMQVAEEDQQYTGFAFEGICYVFCRVPFGLRNSGAALIQCVDKILQGKLQNRVTTYVDDIVLQAKSIEQHFEDLRELFHILKENNLVLNVKKSTWFSEKIEFLGYVITTEGISMKPETIEEIRKIPPPKTVKQVRRFIGTCNYYARFCPRFAEAMHPFYQLTKKDRKWKWDEKYQEAFERVKEMLYNSCFIAHPDFSKKCVVQTDSSDFGMGAMLYQVIDKQEKIVAIASRTLKGPELRFSATEKEANAIIWAVAKFKPYLKGRHFTIRTDHQALTFLSRCHLQNDRLHRWVLALQEFSFDIEHCRGAQNYLPDLLSRHEPGGVSKYVNAREYHVMAIDLGISKSPIFDWNDLVRLQESDDEICKIKRFKQGQMAEEEAEFAKLQQKEDRWKVVQEAVLIKTKDDPEIWRIWIPQDCTKELIRFAHTSLAHFGAEKIHQILQSLCYWKGMRKQIRKVTNSCMTCLKAKYPNRKYDGPMQNIIPTEKNDLAALDVYGPLPRTNHGNKYIFVILDVFSKFVQVYPINKVNSRNCLKLVERFIQIAGSYKRILSDHGTMFTSEKWEEGIRRMGAIPIHSTVRHPQSNPSERIMRELSRLFRTYCKNDHTSWNKLIPDINQWLNLIPHDSTGISPWEAHFQNKPPHILYALERPEISQEPTKTSEQIYQALVKSGKERKSKVKKKSYEFSEGQSVLLRVPKVSNPNLKLYAKFFPLYEGPYVIGKITDKNVAKLLNDKQEVVGHYNFHNLRPCPIGMENSEV